MKISRKLLYLVSFVGLAALAALAVSRIGYPSVAAPLVWAVVAASLAGAPGLIHRRAWPAALLLLPAGAYLILRAQMPFPSSVHGLGGQAGFYLDQLRSGAHTYATHKFPLDLGRAGDLKLLLSLSIYAATGLAAFLALSLRKALPAIVVTLVLLGFGLTVDSDSRVMWLPLGFVLLAGCMLMLSRSLERERWRFGDALTGAATALVATLLALSLLGTTSVSASKPWGNWRAWGPSGDAASRLSFDWMANFPSLLNPQTNALIMRVKSPVASYWRANALDYFNGMAWISSLALRIPLAADGAASSYSYTVPTDDVTPLGKTVTEVFDVQDLYTDSFFTGGSPIKLVLGTQAPVYANGVRALRLPRPLGPSFTYTLTAVIPQLKPTDLVGRGATYPLDVTRFITLPFPAAAEMTGGDPAAEWLVRMADSPAHREWLGLYQLNTSIVASQTDPYEIALRIEEYLRSNYTYSLKPPQTDYESPYAAFLFKTKIGYCQHFAGAMAALLRFNGIPARVAVGFTTGQRAADGTFEVTRNNAHAWVEAYFPQVGWTTFDPTPGRSIPGAGASSTAAGFVNPFGHNSTTGTAGSAAQPSQARPRNPASGRADKLPVGATPSSRIPGWLTWIVALAAALVAWPAGRVVLRRAALRRGSVERRLRATLRVVYAELEDYGVEVPPSRTLQETARFLKEYLSLDATSLACRVEAVLFGGRAATQQDLADMAVFRRELKRRLRARRGWARALLTSYGLPSAAR
jgi:protein-glutamine gamma-glutamyltransferase